MKAKPGAGGPLRSIRPSPAALQRFTPPGSAIAFDAGLATPVGPVPNEAWGLPGFRWTIPAPDPAKTLVWATVSLEWTFYGWRYGFPKNTSNEKLRVEGSLDWRWLLTGHPQLFTYAPILLTDEGHYSFYVDLAPGASGFDVGWLTPPKTGVYTTVPDKLDGWNTSLARLLSMNHNGALELWFALDIRNQNPGGFINPWGPNRIEWVYAYAMPFGAVANEAAWQPVMG